MPACTRVYAAPDAPAYAGSHNDIFIGGVNGNRPRSAAHIPRATALPEGAAVFHKRLLNGRQSSRKSKLFGADMVGDFSGGRVCQHLHFPFEPGVNIFIKTFATDA